MTNYIPPESFILTGLAVLLISLAIFIAVLFVCIAIQKTRSRKYRELLVDMYVIGTIKQFADKDNIDLIKELRDFAKIEKKAKIYEKGLDNVIEQELKNKIAGVQEEKIDK